MFFRRDLPSHSLLPIMFSLERCIGQALSKDERIDTGFIQSYIEKKGKTAVVFQTNQELSNYLTKNLRIESKARKLIAFFSNGSFGGAMQEAVKFFKSHF